MHPLLKIILKFIALLFIAFVGIQSYNLVCTTTSICRPFFLDFYINNLKSEKVAYNFFINSNFLLINKNKNVDVTIDFDKRRSKLNEIVKVKLIYKNLTKNKIIVKNNFEFEVEIIKELTKMLTCPCSSKIKLDAFEQKIVEMEFYYFYPTNKKILEQISEEFSRRTDLIKTEDLNNYNQNNVEKTVDSKLIFTYLNNNITLNFE